MAYLGDNANPVNTTTAIKKTYSASFNTAPATGPNAIMALSGSATKTVKVTKMRIEGSRSTATYTRMSVPKRSTAFTGTSTTITSVPHNATDGAATAVVVSFAGVPTNGTLVGYIWTGFIFMPTITSGVPQTLELNFGNTLDGPIVLNGVNENVSFDLLGVAITGANISWYIEWTEE